MKFKNQLGKVLHIPLKLLRNTCLLVILFTLIVFKSTCITNVIVIEQPLFSEEASTKKFLCVTDDQSDYSFLLSKIK